MSEEKQQINAVKYCEEKYPETTAEFKKILREQYELFCKKQMNYGPDNISVGTKLETPEEVKLFFWVKRIPLGKVFRIPIQTFQFMGLLLKLLLKESGVNNQITFNKRIKGVFYIPFIFKTK